MSADVLGVREVDARLVEHDWPWIVEEQERIEANWRRRLALTPEIFNGPVLVMNGVRRDGDVLRVGFFRTEYRYLLANLDLGGDGTVTNGFAMGVLRGSCGGFVLAEMAAHTANAGHLYFPAGTPDPSDVTADGRVDLASSILREIEEETGLPPGLCRLGDGWHVVRGGRRTAFLRAVWLSITAAEAEARIVAHLAAEPRPELARIEVIRGPDEIDGSRMPALLPEYLRWLMSREAQG